MIIDIDSTESLKNATLILKKGGVLIFPTDTVYGIGCALKKSAIRKLYKIKNRPATQPTAVLMNRNIFDSKREKVLEFDYDLENNFYGGVLTIVDSAANYATVFPKMILSSDNKIGVRLPQHAWLEELIDKVGPIVATSANKKGYRPPSKFADIQSQIIKEADLVIQTDETLAGTPSQIYDLENKKYLR